jgi:hypothetical protein
MARVSTDVFNPSPEDKIEKIEHLWPFLTGIIHHPRDGNIETMFPRRSVGSVLMVFVPLFKTKSASFTSDASFTPVP